MKAEPQIYEYMVDIFEWEHDHCHKHICIDMCEEWSHMCIYIWICIDYVYRELSYIHMCIMIYIEHKANKIQDCKNLSFMWNTNTLHVEIYMNRLRHG